MASTEGDTNTELSFNAVGWLNVWEVAHRNEQKPSLDGEVPTAVWEPCFCVLLGNKRRLAHFRTEKQADETYKNREHPKRSCMRLDDGKEAFDKRWGYQTLDSIKENVSQHDYGPLGVPILHLISIPFPDEWHKVSDNESALDFDVIENIGRILRIFVAEYLHLLP